MSTPLVVVGAGGFGREVLDIVDALNRAAETVVFEIIGVLDANPSAENLGRLSARSVRYLGTESAWRETGSRAQYLIGVGNPAARQEIDKAFTALGLTAATVVHPAATTGSSFTVGQGSVLCGGVQVSTNVTLGRHVHLNPNSIIGHDSVLNDFVSINPSATISGDVRIGPRSLVGAGAVVLQGLCIGADTVVGASACVTRGVGDRSVVKGIPAR
ncbi:acetyltransferase [Cryobacterium sp. Hz7]|uniref:acetyltransferase n=1 Tax=Cryobacterium sp. Hz7 TaxID=1259166 RepID=UPI00106D101B|nr:acetyltransferase [Cryobacterium sp. Hz7]TFB66756.1 acetyltransferase [Cryobacterium sp. Hz7]